MNHKVKIKFMFALGVDRRRRSSPTYSMTLSLCRFDKKHLVYKFHLNGIYNIDTMCYFYSQTIRSFKRHGYKWRFLFCMYVYVHLYMFNIVGEYAMWLSQTSNKTIRCTRAKVFFHTSGLLLSRS